MNQQVIYKESKVISNSHETWQYAHNAPTATGSAVFTISPAYNLPYRPLRLFVEADSLDMQPYLSNCITADDYFEALGIIARRALRAGLVSYRVRLSTLRGAFDFEHIFEGSI